MFMESRKSFRWLALLAVLLCSNGWARDKTDIVWLSNGDRITGEIKQLERGRLKLKTDSMGELSIEWNDIVKIESPYEFQFERSDGTRVTGTIEETPEKKRVSVKTDKANVEFAHENLVRMSQIEDRFLDRLKGSLSFGYSFTKASKVAQGNLGFQLKHRTEIRALTAEGNTIITTDQANETTQRSNLRFGLTRFWKDRFFSAFIFGLERNDELGLKLRTSAGAGVGRYLVQTNYSELSAVGGLLVTNEALASDVSSKQNLEGLLGLEYARYIFDDPQLNLNSRISLFPGITDSGRNRAQLDVSLRWEVFKDLFWDLSYYNSYDSNPPSGSESTNDYGIVSSLGWSF